MIDGDNLLHSHAETLMQAAARFSTLTIKGVYGNVTKLNGWCAAPDFDAIHSGTGKNSANLLLSVEVTALYC